MGTVETDAFERDLDTNRNVRKGYSFERPDYTDLILELKDGASHHDIIPKLIEAHTAHRNRMLINQKRYQTDITGVPIFARKLERDVTTDNRINNDYFSEIVDIKTGYFAGRQASYSYDSEEENYDEAIQRITDFLERNRIAKVNMETTKNCAIAGYSARLLYLDPRGNERMMYIPGHQAILLNEDGNITETEYALRYYGRPGEYVIQFYDDLYRYKYKQEDGKLKLLEQSIHGFKLCPLFGYANNDELIGDAEKVLTLIDAIDRTTSDVNSEIEAFRLAYLLIMGYQIGQESLDNMIKTGALAVSGTMGNDGGDVRYLEKNMNDTAIENHLNRLHNAIYRFSGTPDLSDEAFSGNASGVALKFKLTGLETKCSRFEQNFKEADTRMFEIMATKWEVENVYVNPFKVFSDFKRNFPQDLLYEADVLQKHGVRLSEKTVLGLMPSIDDVQYEIDQKRREEEDRISEALKVPQDKEGDADGLGETV